MMTENIRLQRSSMPSRLSRHAVIVAAAGLCLVAAVAARAQQPRSLYDRYTEPIQIFKTGLGTFTQADLVDEQGGAGVLRPGLPDDVFVRQARGGAVVPRGVEARSRVRDLLLGRGVGVGLVPERADDRRGSAARVRRGAEGAVAEEPGHAQGARAHRRDGGPLRREVRRRQARRAGPRLCRRDGEGLGAVSRRSRDRHALRRRAVPARAAPRHARRQRSQRSAAASGAREHPGARRAPSRAPAISTCTPPSPRSCPGRAEACAEFLGRSIPGASHINHMPSHTWNEVGRWGDSVRANLEAWHSDQKAAIGEGFAIYPEHNLHMLLYAASYDGQGAIAMRAGKDYTKLTGDTFYEVLTLIRFGRFDEVLQVTNRPKAGDPGRALGLRAGLRAPQAGQRRFRQPLSWRASRRRPRHRRRCSASTPAKDLLVDRGRHPRGRDSADRGRSRRARSRRSSRRRGLQEALVYDEPEPLPFSRIPLARRRARSKRSASPKRRRRIAPSSRIIRTTAGRCSACKQALEGMGNESSEVAADLAASWSRSDTWIQSSRF